MRRIVSVFCGLALTGCSGSWFGTYVHDVTRMPGRIPNQPVGKSYNDEKVLAVKDASVLAPLTEQSAAIWPGPPKNVPSLQDLQRQQNEQLASGTYSLHQMSPDLPVLPGYPVTPPDQVAGSPVSNFPKGVVVGTDRRRLGILSGAETTTSVPSAPSANGSIIVPNGDGSSTVIGPDGSVSSRPAPK